MNTLSTRTPTSTPTPTPTPAPDDQRLDSEVGRFLAQRTADLQGLPSAEDTVAALSARLAGAPARHDRITRPLGRTRVAPDRGPASRPAAAPAPALRRYAMLTATGLAAAIAALALGSGALFLGAGGDPTPSPAAPSPSQPAQAWTFGPYLPAELPADLPGGTIDTPLGPARWVHLSGDATTLPGPLGPMADPAGGLLWFESGSYWGGGGGPDWGWEPALWASEDAVSPKHQIELPVSARFAHLEVVGGAFWLTTDDPPTLWWSADARTWEPIDLSDLASPGPPELRWEAHLGTPATSGPLTAIPIGWTAEDPGRLLGRADLGRRALPREASPGIYRVMEVKEGCCGAIDTGVTVRVTETDTGLRFADMTGATIAELTGADLGLVEAWAEDWEIRVHGLVLIEAGQVSTSKVPGPSIMGSEGYPHVAILGTEAGFTAFRLAPGETLRAWHSDDGRAWTEGEPIGDREGEPQQVEGVWSVAGPTPAVRATLGERYWETADGVSWSTVPTVGGAAAQRLARGGWADPNAGRISMDGETWEQVPGIVSDITKWGGSAVRAIIGDTLFWGVAESEGAGQRDLWVIEFEPAAAADATP